MNHNFHQLTAALRQACERFIVINQIEYDTSLAVWRDAKKDHITARQLADNMSPAFAPLRDDAVQEVRDRYADVLVAAGVSPEHVSAVLRCRQSYVEVYTLSTLILFGRG